MKYESTFLIMKWYFKNSSSIFFVVISSSINHAYYHNKRFFVFYLNPGSISILLGNHLEIKWVGQKNDRENAGLIESRLFSHRSPVLFKWNPHMCFDTKDTSAAKCGQLSTGTKKLLTTFLFGHCLVSCIRSVKLTSNQWKTVSESV